MTTFKPCKSCGRDFRPHPQVPKQLYCSAPECQRERRRSSQQKKRRHDSDYRENDTRYNKEWASRKVSIGFDLEPLTLPVEKILPTRQTLPGVATTRKFQQIRSSIEEVGIIEPLSVAAADPTSGQHILLDGHLRLIALKELNQSEVQCLIATDDESYTYKNRINRLSSVQEHYMILRAISEE